MRHNRCANRRDRWLHLLHSGTSRPIVRHASKHEICWVSGGKGDLRAITRPGRVQVELHARLTGGSDHPRVACSDIYHGDATL